MISDETCVLAVCGWSGSGKTTLLEAVVVELVARGLRVALVKHDAHGIDVDRPGKDSDRLFSAGANICLRGPNEILWRVRPGITSGLDAVVAQLSRSHDLVLVEGHKDTPIKKFWLATADQLEPPEHVTEVLEVLPWDSERRTHLLGFLERWLPEVWRKRRLFAGVLLGGGSRRMGFSKQLLELGGRSFVDRAYQAVEPQCDEIVLLGDGEVPGSFACTTRLPDVVGAGGPMAGMLAAMRWQPEAAWIFLACDMPLVSAEAIAWLIDQREPGRWAIVPQDREGRLEPLFAVYEPQAGPCFEELLMRGIWAPRRIAEILDVWSIAPPKEFARAWVNVNTAEDLKTLKASLKTS